MKRLVSILIPLFLSAACHHPLIGKPETALLAKMGQPESVGSSGQFKVYAYHIEVDWFHMQSPVTADELEFQSRMQMRRVTVRDFNPVSGTSPITWTKEKKSAYERFWVDQQGIVRKYIFSIE